MANPPLDSRPPQLREVTLPRLNFFGSALQPVPVGAGPATGYFRTNYCDASALDPASHTVAAVITPEFLDFSASQGNDLRPLFPLTGPLSPTSSPTTSPCTWCLCASRWAQAFRASLTHPQGEAIVPRLLLESTHERAMRDSGLGEQAREVMERFAVGGDGEGGGGAGAAGGPRVGGRGGNVGR